MEAILGGSGLFGFITNPFKTLMSAGALKDKAAQTFDNVNIFLIFAEIILLFLFFYVLIFLVMRVYKNFFVKRVKKMLMLFVRAKNEILILEHLSDVPKNQHLEEQLSFDETMTLLIKEFEHKSYSKRIPMHDRKRIVDGLTLIKSEKTDIDTKLLLLDNCVKVFDTLLT
jgi:hypothetical protein